MAYRHRADPGGPHMTAVASQTPAAPAQRRLPRQSSAVERLSAKRYEAKHPPAVYPLDNSSAVRSGGVSANSSSGNAGGSSSSGNSTNSANSGKTYPDFHPWTRSPAEDTIAIRCLDKGYAEPPFVESENVSARNVIHKLIQDRRALTNFSVDFVKAFQLRANHNRVTTNSVYKPPPRVTLTDHKRENWLHDLASPLVPLRKLSRTIPHGIRNRILLDQCCSKNIPIPRALWLVRCVGSNELRGLKRKGNYGSGSISEREWIGNWTDQVTDFIEKTAVDCYQRPIRSGVGSSVAGGAAGGAASTRSPAALLSPALTPGMTPGSAATPPDAASPAATSATAVLGNRTWKDRMHYLLRLAAALYNEQLVAKRQFLQWVVAFLRTRPIEEVPLGLLVAQLFFSEVAQHDELARGLAQALLYHVADAQRLGNSDPLFGGLAAQLSEAVRRLFRVAKDAFVLPSHWETLGPVLQSVLGPTAAEEFRTVKLRNEALLVGARKSKNTTNAANAANAETVGLSGGSAGAAASLPSLRARFPPASHSATARALEILDAAAPPFDPDTLVAQLNRCRLPPSQLIRTVLEWATTRFRVGKHRAYLAVALIDLWQSEIPISVCRDAVLDYLFSVATPSTCDLDAVHVLCSELFYAGGIITAAAYVRRVISSGVIYVAQLREQAEFHMKVVANLPDVAAEKAPDVAFMAARAGNVALFDFGGQRAEAEKWAGEIAGRLGLEESEEREEEKAEPNEPEEPKEKPKEENAEEDELFQPQADSDAEMDSFEAEFEAEIAEATAAAAKAEAEAEAEKEAETAKITNAETPEKAESFKSPVFVPESPPLFSCEDLSCLRQLNRNFRVELAIWLFRKLYRYGKSGRRAVFVGQRLSAALELFCTLGDFRGLLRFVLLAVRHTTEMAALSLLADTCWAYLGVFSACADLGYLVEQFVDRSSEILTEMVQIDTSSDVPSDVPSVSVAPSPEGLRQLLDFAQPHFPELRPQIAVVCKQLTELRGPVGSYARFLADATETTPGLVAQPVAQPTPLTQLQSFSRAVEHLAVCYARADGAVAAGTPVGSAVSAAGFTPIGNYSGAANGSATISQVLRQFALATAEIRSVDPRRFAGIVGKWISEATDTKINLHYTFFHDALLFLALYGCIELPAVATEFLRQEHLAKSSPETSAVSGVPETTRLLHKLMLELWFGSAEPRLRLTAAERAARARLMEAQQYQYRETVLVFVLKAVEDVAQQGFHDPNATALEIPHTATVAAAAAADGSPFAGIAESVGEFLVAAVAAFPALLAEKIDSALLQRNRAAALHVLEQLLRSLLFPERGPAALRPDSPAICAVAAVASPVNMRVCQLVFCLETLRDSGPAVAGGAWGAQQTLCRCLQLVCSGTVSAEQLGELFVCLEAGRKAELQEELAKYVLLGPEFPRVFAERATNGINGTNGTNVINGTNGTDDAPKPNCLPYMLQLLDFLAEQTAEPPSGELREALLSGLRTAAAFGRRICAAGRGGGNGSRVSRGSSEGTSALRDAVLFLVKLFVIYQDAFATPESDPLFDGLGELWRTPFVQNSPELRGILSDVAALFVAALNRANSLGSSGGSANSLAVQKLTQLTEPRNGSSERAAYWHETPAADDFVLVGADGVCRRLAVQPFDLLEESNPVVGPNDAVLDLQLFRAIVEKRNPR